MDPIFFLIVLGGFLYGTKRAGEDAASAVARAWRGSGRQAMSGAPSNAGGGTIVMGGRGSGTGRRLAVGTAAVIAGTGTVGREFAAGWRRGWPEGKERARARFGSQTTTANDDPPPADKAATPGQTGGQPPPAIVPDPPTGPLNDTTTTTTDPKEPAMTLTTHSGDISSMSEYERALEADIKRSADEVDDAQAGLQRAEEDINRNDQTSAALAGMKVDRQTLAELATIGDAVKARHDAHQKLLEAAENEHAANTAALEGVRARHGAIKEHADVVADRAFYTQGD